MHSKADVGSSEQDKMARRTASPAPAASPSRQVAVMSPGGILDVQRSMGNSAVCRLLARTPAPSTGSGLVVQRYKKLGRDAVGLPPAKQQHKQEMFERHSVDPRATDLEEKLDWGNVTAQNPGLLASDDLTIVIQDTDKEPQEFYGTKTVFDKAKKVLEDHDSLIGIRQASGSLTLGGHKLSQVKPVSNMVPVKEKVGNDVERLVDHICINFANVVMGLGQTNRTHAMVMQTPGSSEMKRTAIRSNELKSEQVNKLASKLGSKEDLSKDRAATAMSAKGTVGLGTGEAYGRALGSGDIKDTAKALGVNEYAMPQVGEGYATYSVKTDNLEKNLNYAALDDSGKAQVLDHIWGYHYAGVVAESGDGKDKVTLENYNRRGDVFEAYAAKLVEQFKSTLRVNVEERVKEAINAREPATALAGLYAELKGGNSEEQKTAAERLKKAMTESLADGVSAWFFRLYGTETGKGQTFHERAATSGYFANPLTVRVADNAVGSKDGTKYDQKTTRQFGQLAKVAYDTPLDYKEEESFVREREVAYKARTDLADTIKAAGDAVQARTCLKEGLKTMRTEQAAAHVAKAAATAKTAGTPENKIPEAKLRSVPKDVHGYEAKFDTISTACIETLKKTWWINSGKRARLGNASKVALELKAAVTDQFTYYNQHLG